MKYMKKYFLILIMLLTMPAFALCPVSQSGACKLTENIQPEAPVFKNDSIKFENKTPDNIQMQNPDIFLNRSKGKKGVMIESSLGCQFGNCNHGLNNDFLENQ